MVQEAYSERERTLVVNTRNLAESLLSRGLLEHMRVELQARLDTIASQAEELRESSQRIVAAQDGERRRMARDLHDGLQQQLLVLRMQVGMIEDGAGDVGLSHLGEQLDSVIEQLREVTHNLYPSILVDRGLTAALHSYVAGCRCRCGSCANPRSSRGLLPPRRGGDQYAETLRGVDHRAEAHAGRRRRAPVPRPPTARSERPPALGIRRIHDGRRDGDGCPRARRTRRRPPRLPSRRRRSTLTGGPVNILGPAFWSVTPS